MTDADLPFRPDDIRIRAEETADIAAIHALVTAAFGRPDEADLVDALRDAGSLSLSFIATRPDGVIVGHVALSRLLSPADSLALAPVSVAPSVQRHGIGSRLIRVALTRAHQGGSAMVFVLGDPAWYRRFGFTTEAAAGFESPYAGPHFMALRLGKAAVDPVPVIYPDAFARLG